ncbi:MAG TPA: NUDIX hydrolase [Patescibacteria group bacterium]|nr:NUDIX hydrolase [Patescibacteria group bacterium]
MISCKFENDTPANLRHVTVGSIVVNDQNQILLVKRAVEHRFGKYSIPGGFLDRDENTQEGTLRELKEETGYEGKIDFLFRVNDNPERPKEDRQNVDFLYVCKVIGGEPTLNHEVSEIKWFTEAELPIDEEFAFDHRETILKYFEYLKQPFQLPIIG